MIAQPHNGGTDHRGTARMDLHVIAMQHIHLAEVDQPDSPLHIADVNRFVVAVQDQDILVEWVHICPIAARGSAISLAY